MRQAFTKIVKIFLLVLFTSYYGSTTLFIHTHILHNTYIVHSHPFSDGNSKSPVTHQHTENQYLIIQALSFFVSTFLMLFFAALLFLCIKQILFLFNRIVVENTDNILQYLLRAPPYNTSL